MSVAGRVVALRDHGKTCFAHLMDQTGRDPALRARRRTSATSYAALHASSTWATSSAVTGELFRTRTGELTVAVKAFELLAKALRPLPEKWHGLKDVETRYRQRYVDLVVNPEVREVFRPARRGSSARSARSSTRAASSRSRRR